MAGKKIAKKNILKVKFKQRKKKEISVSPRLSLEPRLTPSSSKKRRHSLNNIHESEESSVCFQRNEPEESILQQEMFCDGNSNLTSSFEEQQKYEMDAAASFMAEEECISYKAASSETIKIKKAKIKQRKKKEISVAPRLRLEPRLTTSSSKKKKCSQDNIHESEQSSICFEGNEQAERISQREMFCEGNSDITSSYKEQQENEIDAASRFMAEVESLSYKAASSETQSPRKNAETELNNYFKQMTEQHEQRMRVLKGASKGYNWNDRERMDLAIALQTYGFLDMKKIADCVKTKNENDIQQFLKLRRRDAFTDTSIKKYYRHGNSWSTMCPEYVATWPNIRKWRKMAYEQMLSYTRTKDYSKTVISSLCKQFYEEEEEPVDPQVINVKLIYKYMMCCMSGAIPPQLPPKESALVLDLLREVRLMPIAYDFEEERKFLQDFRSATTFKPFQIKDEFKKRYQKVPDEVFSANTIAVPEEIFLDLSRHKKLTQSFSPLVTPVWMLQKEQEVLEKYAEESNVYVD